MVITEAGRPPILEQPGREPVAVVTGSQVTVMDQHFERICDAVGGIVDQRRVQSFKAAPCVRGEHVLGSRLGKDL